MAAILGTLALFAPVGRAETPEYDCGPTGVYQVGAAWPGERGCSTGLGVSRALGPAVIVDKIAAWNGTATAYAWKTSLTGAMSAPAIGAKGDIYIGAGANLHALKERGGAVRWTIGIGGESRGTPAIGADGTIYVATVAGRIVAVKPNGTLKWQHDLAGAPAVHASIVLGPGGRIYVADTAGTVTALVDQGTGAAVAWSKALGAPIEVTPATSRNGGTLYVGTTAGAFSAIATSSGATSWTAPIAAGEASAPVVDADGVIYVGAASGKLYALQPATGAVRWQRELGTAVRTPVLGPAGTLFVNAAVTDQTDRLFEVDLAGSVLWQAAVTSLAPVTVPLVDDSGDVYMGAGRNFFMPVSGWSLSIGWGLVRHAAMTNAGSILIIRDSTVFSLGPGDAPAPYTPVGRVEPIAVPFNLDSDADYETSTERRPVTYCSAAPVLGPAKPSRPGVSFLMKKISGGAVCTAAEYKSASCAMSDVTLGASDPGCPVTFCDDDETSIALDDGKKLIDDVNGNMPALPASYADRVCEAEPAPVRCTALDQNHVKWSTTACTDDASCETGYVCAAVCKTGNQTSGPPPETCLPEKMRKQCVKLDTKRCTGLPELAGANACHEVRECAAAADKVSRQDAEPVCKQGNTVVDCAAATPPTAPTNKTEMRATYPALGLWSNGGEGAVCSLTQPENASDNDGAGREPDSAKNKGKKWGLSVSGKASAKFDIDPIAYGLFKPNVGATGDFKILARVLGNDITVLGLHGDAGIRGCTIEANATVTLFNQDIHAVEESIAPGDDNGSGCRGFFDEIEYVLGDVKKGLVQAARMRGVLTQMIDLNAGKLPNQKTLVALTKTMCTAAFPNTSQNGTSVPNPVCAGDYLTKANAVKIANAYIDRYNRAVSQLEQKIETAKAQMLAPWFEKLAAKGFDTSDGLGYTSTVEIVPKMGQEFSIVGARAVFPIGPLALTLEIQGTGGWGVSGDLTYGAKLFTKAGSPEPGFKAIAGIKPHAHVDVDVFLGIGYDFGIGGAAVGFGGYITLVRIEAPITGGAELALTKRKIGDKNDAQAAENDPRQWPADLVPFKKGKLLRDRVEYTWQQKGKIGAALDFQFLKGELDVRLRVRFMFFSKTWKKRIAKLPGLHKRFEWAGSIDVPLSLPALDLHINDPLPLPKLEPLDADDFWFGEANPSRLEWPDVTDFPTAVRSKVTKVNQTADLSDCTIEIL
jgi:outer membrane protein assembly factor BamB